MFIRRVNNTVMGILLMIYAAAHYFLLMSFDVNSEVVLKFDVLE